MSHGGVLAEVPASEVEALRARVAELECKYAAALARVIAAEDLAYEAALQAVVAEDRLVAWVEGLSHGLAREVDEVLTPVGG